MGVDCPISKHVYKALDPEEQTMRHPHEYRECLWQLCLRPICTTSRDAQEIEIMKEVSGLYGKTWHTWQVDGGDELPMPVPTLMGSLTRDKQIDSEKALENRIIVYGVDHKHEAVIREKAGVQAPGFTSI